MSKRRWIAALAALVLILGAVTAYALLRPRGDVSDPGVAFEEPSPTATATPTAPGKGNKKRKRAADAADSFVWPRYGYTKDHRRVFKPEEPVRGPWRRVWKHRAPALLEFPPVIAGRFLYQLADNGRLAAIVKRTGRVRWKRKLGTLAASTPAFEDGHLYVSILETGSKRGRVVSLRARDGKISWSRTLPSRTESSPLVHNGKVFVGSENGTLYALREETGRVQWTYRAAGAIKGSPTFSGGLLYFGDYGGRVQAVRASNGMRVWNNDAARALLRGGEYYATAAVAFGRVYIGATDGRMYSFSARNGRLAWAYQTGRYVYSSAAIDTVPKVGPTVFFGSYDGRFYAVDARSGRVRWRHVSGGRISGSPTIVGDTVYFADLGRRVTIGLRTSDGGRAFRFPQGAYDPVVSDGRYLFVTGAFGLHAFLPRQEAVKSKSAGKAGASKKPKPGAGRRTRPDTDEDRRPRADSRRGQTDSRRLQSKASPPIASANAPPAGPQRRPAI